MCDAGDFISKRMREGDIAYAAELARLRAVLTQCLVAMRWELEASGGITLLQLAEAMGLLGQDDLVDLAGIPRWRLRRRWRLMSRRRRAFRRIRDFEQGRTDPTLSWLVLYMRAVGWDGLGALRRFVSGLPYSS